MVTTSSMRGTFLIRHSSSVSRQAARMGRTAFLEPLMGTRPTNRDPPSIRSCATDPLGYQPAPLEAVNYGYQICVASDPPAAAKLRESQPSFGSSQSGRGGGLVGVGELLLKQTLGATARLLGAGFVDVVGPLRGVRQDGDLVRPHFQESARDEEELLLALVADLHGAGRQRRQQGDVPRQDAELALRPGGDHEIGIAFEPTPFDSDDVDVKLIGHALFGSLAFLCDGLRFRLLRLVALRLLSLRLLSLRLLSLRLVALWLSILRLLRLWLRVLLAAAFTFRRLNGLVDRAHHVAALLGEVVLLAR